uniref:ORF1 n=1 Tax=Grapevine satellite virus TaxID=1343493 RepID=A0A4D6E9R7_9VIRU|nr:ORF1 [Grapevine satellite virus]
MVNNRRKNTSRRRGVPALREVNYATVNAGTQTAFARKDLQILAGCGDRSFKLVGLALQVSSLSEPVIVQVHIFNEALKEIALCNRLVAQGNTWLRLRIPLSYKQWWSGETTQSQTLVRVDLIPTYKNQNTKVSFLLSVLCRLGTSEITAHP